jgi:hypothetical protein
LEQVDKGAMQTLAIEMSAMCLGYAVDAGAVHPIG